MCFFFQCLSASRSSTSVSHEIQRAVPAICSYRHPVVLVMEMGGDTHSFRSITYMAVVRGLLRHRENLVNRRTLRVPRGEEGRKGGGGEHDKGSGKNTLAFLVGTVIPPSDAACTFRVCFRPAL